MKQFLLVVLSLAAIGNFLYNSTPPTGEDELVYHISLPAQWLKAGELINTPDNPNSFFPMNGELITTLMLYWGGWRLAKIWVWITGLLMAWALYLFGRKHAGLTVEGSLWATAILYTMPCITSLNGTTSVDQLNLLFEILSVYFLMDWNLLGAGYFMGMSLGTRPYSVAWAVAALICWGEWTFVGVMAFAFVVPYLCRNWMLTGNPFYPRAFWPGAAQDVYFRAMETEYAPKGLWAYIKLPVWLSFGGRTWGCGPIPLLTIWPRMFQNHRLWLFSGLILVITALVPMTLINPRYFSPLFPWLAILAAQGIMG